MIKKLVALLMVLTLSVVILPVYAEDAVSSATVNISSLPELAENPDAKILVIYFSTDDTLRTEHSESLG